MGAKLPKATTDSRTKEPKGPWEAIGAKFYQERTGARNCLVRLDPKGDPTGIIASVYDHPNSGCCGTSCSLEWLRNSARRMRESEARKIHPMLFMRLGDPET